jgi:predicted metal-dependent HD superfamily phosphohydrolase
MDDELRGAWDDLAAELGMAPGPAARVRDDLARRHGEPHRAYHTLAHVRQVLADVDALAAAGEPVTDLPALRLAAWFHDAVYDPLAGGNERASADLAEQALRGLGVDRDRRAAVTGLILATAEHLPTSPDARLLVDADLAVLGATAAHYAAYRRDVRREYAALPEPRWRRGRAAVLTRLLARRPLYTTVTMRARAEAAARRNLCAELAELGG